MRMVIIFVLTRPGIEPQSTASVADALSTILIGLHAKISLDRSHIWLSCRYCVFCYSCKYSCSNCFDVFETKTWRL